MSNQNATDQTWEFFLSEQSVLAASGYEAAWQEAVKGVPQPNIETFLEAVPASQRPLLRSYLEKLSLEYSHRLARLSGDSLAATLDNQLDATVETQKTEIILPGQVSSPIRPNGLNVGSQLPPASINKGDTVCPSTRLLSTIRCQAPTRMARRIPVYQGVRSHRRSVQPTPSFFSIQRPVQWTRAKPSSRGSHTGRQDPRSRLAPAASADTGLSLADVPGVQPRRQSIWLRAAKRQDRSPGLWPPGLRRPIDQRYLSSMGRDERGYKLADWPATRFWASWAGAAWGRLQSPPAGTRIGWWH